MARCPAHDDRQASLSIAEGRGGRTLLRCFAGCEVQRVVAALGVAMHDLFELRPSPTRTERHARLWPNGHELRGALVAEERVYRERHGVEGLLLTGELNRIRDIVGARYGVQLAPLPQPLHEGSYGGRERDPGWPAVFEWALREASVELLGAPIAFDEAVAPPRAILLDAEERAARAMRSIEAEARGLLREEDA